MKRISISILAGIFILVAPRFARADSITPNTVDFFGDGTDSGRTYKILSGLGSPTGNEEVNFPYTHSITFSPPAATITSATITLSHKKNNNNPSAHNEVWIIYPDGSSTPLGELVDSNTAWVDQDFPIPSSLYPVLPTGSWSLAIKLNESTGGADDLWIDKSVVTGEYVPGSLPPITQTPEPSSLFLLGSGLLGLGLLRRRMK